jgi:hypothetical protein
VACSIHIVKKNGIRSLFRKPGQEEPRRLGRIMQMSVFERKMMGGLDVFVRVMVRGSGRFFCSS